MAEKRFDVLPVALGATVEEYFQTTNWGDYSSIVREQITEADIVPLQTSIRDIIRDFASEDRLFYFLGNKDRIAGLISIVNLNARRSKYTFLV